MTEIERQNKVKEFSQALLDLCEAYISEDCLSYAEMLGILVLTQEDVLSRLRQDIEDEAE